jgi:hypothetical protein
MTRPYYPYLNLFLIMLRRLLRREIGEQELKTMRTTTAIADIPPIESVLGITILALPQTCAQYPLPKHTPNKLHRQMT